MNKRLNVGDIVCLKSGGPEMTVQEINGDNYLLYWFAKGQLKKATLPLYVLEVCY